MAISLLDQLVLTDLLPERLPLVGVAHGGVDARLGEPDRAGGDREAPLVDGAHRDEEPLALLADPMLLRHDDVVEIDEAGVAGPDAELAVQRARGQPRHPALQQERRHALVLLGAVDAGEDQEVVGEIGQPDPELLAVEAVGRAVAAGRGLEIGGIGADAWLGQAEGRELLAAGLRDEPALALLLRPPLQEGQRVEARHARSGRRGTSVSARSSSSHRIAKLT